MVRVPEIKSWVQRGWLKLTRGSIVDYAAVKEDIRKAVLDHKLNVLALYYDKQYANETTQALHEGEAVGGHSVAGVVAQRVDFPQAMSVLSPPSKTLERLVIAGLVQHPGNGVLTWQVSHCEVKADANQNIRPVKPGRDSVKTIDGVPRPADVSLTVLALDPSAGKDDKPADYRAHVLVRMDRKGHFWVDCECRREPLPDTVRRSAELARQHRPQCVAIEAGPALAMIAQEYERLSGKDRLPCDLDMVAWTEKQASIRRLGSYLAAGQIHVRNTPGGRLLVQQLREFPAGAFDDGPHALEIAIRRMEMMV